MWREKFLKTEKKIKFSKYQEREFDIWFLSRYHLSEVIRMEIIGESAGWLVKKSKMKFRLRFSFRTVFKLKNREWVFPHSRTINTQTGEDQYVYPHFSSASKKDLRNLGYSGVDSMNLNMIVGLLAKVLSIFPSFYIGEYRRNILKTYEENFEIKEISKKKLLEHSKRQYIMYKIYRFILFIYSPTRIHFSDRSDKYPLILASRKAKIPMVEYQHGLPLEKKFNYDFGYLNEKLFSHILFKYCFDSPKYVEALKRLGMKLAHVKSRVALTSSFFSERDSSAKKNVIILMQPEFYDIIQKLRYDHIRSANFLIKPHPCEDVNKYSELRKYSHVKILSSESNILYEVLPTVDIVIGFYSTALVEAKLLNKKCYAVSNFDELGGQIAEIFDIEEVALNDIFKIINKWH